jgi:streptomycin 6-kinase
MSSEMDELWLRFVARIESDRGWLLRPLARLGRSHDDRRTWLAEGTPGAVVVKLSTNTFALERAGWTAEALVLLRRRGVPVPLPLWWGCLDERWWALVQPQLPGEPVDALDEPVLEQLLALVELQADHDLGAGGWDVSWWIDKVVFEGWEGWWDGAEQAAPQTARRLRALLEPATGYRLPIADLVHGDFGVGNFLVQDGTVSGIVDWDHLGIGSRALDLTSLLFDWQRLRLADSSSVTEDGGQRLTARIVEIAGEHGFRSSVCYAAIARLALSRQRGEPDQVETWRRVTESILDSCIFAMETGRGRLTLAGPAPMTVRLPEPLPEGVRALGADVAGRAWLSTLAHVLEEVVENWQLEVGEPFEDASASLTLRAVRSGEPVVVKLQFPHREAEQEAAALLEWDGDGAIRLLGHDPERHALLLEPCRPGTPLFELEQDAALDVLIELLPRLWRQTEQAFMSLADEAGHWAETLPRSWERAGRPFERRLLEAALALIGELAPTQGEQVIVHQDLHAGNVLRAEREPWLVIDPKPLVGEREFGLAPVVRGAELGHSREHVLHRLDRLSSGLALDRDRACGWAFVQTLAWGIEESVVWPEMIEIARWLLDAR